MSDELRPQVPQNIRVIVFDSDNNRLELSVAYDLTHEDWEYYLKIMMIFLGFGVDRIEINPEVNDD